MIEWSRSVTHLGIQVDSSLRYEDQVDKTVEKTVNTVMALSRLMPNIGGSREMKRRLLNSVIHAKMLYGAPIWAEAMQRKWTRQKLGSLQRRSAMRITSSYSTVSKSAVLVLTSTPPIDLLAMERQEIYLEMKRGVASSENGDRKAEIKRMARERLVKKWQQRWDSETTGRWTHTLIPKLRVWVRIERRYRSATI